MASSAPADTTYLASPRMNLPRWQDVLPKARHVEHPGPERHSIYLDTDERDLRRWGCVLRYRNPGPDAEAGWELAVPGGKLGTELHLASADSDLVPDELTAAVAGLTGGRPLRRSVTLGIGEHRHEWYDRKDRLLAQIIVETVQATVIGRAATVEQWHRIHLDLGTAATKKHRTAVTAALARAGAAPAPHRSELEHALAATDAPPPGDAPTDGPPTARRMLGAYLDTQIEAIGAGDVWLRRGLDPVHPLRVGIRRLRSTLRVWQDLFEPAQRTWLDSELSWYSGLLGHVRDRQVQRARLAAALETLPPELVMGPVASRIDADLHADERRHLDEVLRALDSDRYRMLLAALARWRTELPLTEEADRQRAIEKAVRTAERTALRRVRAAAAGEDEQALHRARKAAKRARYAVELAAPLRGRTRAKRTIARYTNIQQVLGEHQDSAVATDLLREFGARAGTTPGENGFTFGLLYGLELQAAEQARRHASDLAT
ncbi:CHAD domain-containing protein [Rhodococcus aetherivorans]|uniref:CYTH and CHAD domain-containing protein n=1 Tax=Rhodococcus aetherivorans TaxID=191292 RepID=UPI001E2B2C50|nr:CHAD domain-containing protein [Rhodococcus aetherivorans]UGQ42422.1 CHAD domain-containing protein [Rhodococcus aetherivorans]